MLNNTYIYSGQAQGDYTSEACSLGRLIKKSHINHMMIQYCYSVKPLITLIQLNARVVCWHYCNCSILSLPEPFGVAMSCCTALLFQMPFTSHIRNMQTCILHMAFATEMAVGLLK